MTTEDTAASDFRENRRKNILHAALDLTTTRAELEAAGTPTDLLENYTRALIHACRETQSSMWGPDYVDPDPSSWAPRQLEGQPVN